MCVEGLIPTYVNDVEVVQQHEDFDQDTRHFFHSECNPNKAEPDCKKAVNTVNCAGLCRPYSEV